MSKSSKARHLSTLLSHPCLPAAQGCVLASLLASRLHGQWPLIIFQVELTALSNVPAVNHCFMSSSSKAVKFSTDYASMCVGGEGGRSLLLKRSFTLISPEGEFKTGSFYLRGSARSTNQDGWTDMEGEGQPQGSAVD